MRTQIDSQTFEEQTLVVAFSDLTGFWRLSRARPAPAVVSTLAAYYMTRPVDTLLKHMWGQSIVGRWGHARRNTLMSLGRR